MYSDILTKRELRLFAEQIKLPSVGIAGQERLKKSSILVIGTGGKGTTVLQNLVAGGAGFIGISDNFAVEESHIPRQRLYGSDDLGKQKAIISKQRLDELSNTATFEIHNICLAANNILDIFSNYDIIVDATDNFPAHYLINDAAIILKKPVVFGSVFHKNGMVAVFNHLGGPSFRCLFPNIPHSSKNPGDDGIYGIGILYSLTGTIMANETISIILGHPVLLSGMLFTFDISNYKTNITSIVRNPENFEITSLE